MRKIDFIFKAFGTGSIPAPFILIKIRYKRKQIESLGCIVDSGADITSIPISFAYSLGIKFNKEAPRELFEEWLSHKSSFSHMRPYYDDFLKRLYRNNFYIKESSTCAHGKPLECFLTPAKIEINGKKFLTMINWMNAKDTHPLLGRFGIFDKVSEVVFIKKKQMGYFLLRR